MRIDFIDVENSSQIVTSLHKITGNPFNIGDSVNLTISELNMKLLRGINNSRKENIINANKKLKDEYQFSIAKIVKIKKYIDFNTTEDGDLVIECYFENIKSEV